METETKKEIIEKKVYEENGHHDDYVERKARNGFGMGLAGVLTGGAALLSQFGGGRGLFGFGSGSGSPENVNINTVGGGSSSAAPTAFQAWEHSCGGILALTNEMWALKTNTLNQMYAHRDTDVAEKFSLWKSQVDGDFALYKVSRDLYDNMNDKLNTASFGLYKGQRDLYDMLNERYAAKFCELDKKVAILEAIQPYQNKLIQEEIKAAYAAGINYTDRKTCRMIEGVVTLPNSPTVTGFPSQRCCSQGSAA